jgi:hypothetical protein
MPDNEEILQAVEALRGEWPELLGDDADVLARWLATTARDDPEAVRQTANRILALLQEHPRARARVSSQLGAKAKGGLPSTLRGYEPLPGSGGEIPAGTLMVCPKDPDHYRRRLRQKGQRPFCPEHGVALVPADSLSSKE